MTPTKATVKGSGPELFGRGIDLLFGNDEAISRSKPESPVASSKSAKHVAASQASATETPGRQPDAMTASLHANGDPDAATVTEADVDQFLRMAAEAFLRVQLQKRQQTLMTQPSRSTSQWDTIAVPPEATRNDNLPEIELDVPPLPDEPFSGDAPVDEPAKNEFDSQAHTDHTLAVGTSDAEIDLELELDVPPVPGQQADAGELLTEQPVQPVLVINDHPSPPFITDSVEVSEEEIMSDQPIGSESTETPVVSENGQPRKVAPPGVTVSGPVTTLSGSHSDPEDGELSATLVDRELPAMSRKEVEEILNRLPKSDLRALDKQIDQLYEDVTALFSGKRREITVAFEILRKARIILLKDPEQYAEAEFYVRQVQARVHQVRQSIEEGSRYWPRLLIYQTGWLVVLSIIALITTVNGANFEGWIAYLLGVPSASESVGWAVLFISTLAWGGIGGATSAMWSLYYHISVQRDYEPIENLWYYTQPLIGMVLGGIVFLIMGAGFLVVDATPTVGVGSMGARLVPAVIAVIAGFRQTVVLDLIERIVGLIVPTQNNPGRDTPTEELTI